MNLNRREFVGSLAATAGELRAATKPSPNIVVILVDDMGFSDVGCYGSEIRTPNIDALAGAGVKFTQFYNCARCCPSRASLLTGLYPHQAGVGHMVDKAGPLPGYADDLSPRSRTIAEVLKPAGYQTLMVGKWHVTPVNNSKTNWPLQRGFDQYYGIIHGAADYFNPVTLTRGNSAAEPAGKDYYFTDALGDEAEKFIASASTKKDPFFLYAAFTAPHWPLHARVDDIAKCRGRYHAGWDALRKARHARQLDSGLLHKQWDLSLRDATVPAWEEAADREWQERRMEVYAAMVERLDQNIGKIVKKLRETGQEDNTLVLFMADNGGCAEEIGPKWKGLHIPHQTSDGRPVRIGNTPGVMPGAQDTYQSYGVPWANASNTPFRLYKHWVHEGGIATPLIARWPARIRALKTPVEEPSHFVDIMATCIDAANASYPKEARGQSILPLAGRSLLPMMTGMKHESSRTIFWEHEGNCAARRGTWKLVRKYPGDWELYDMAEDRTELNDRSKDRPQVVQDLSTEWDEWAKMSGVLLWSSVVGQLVDR